MMSYRPFPERFRVAFSFAGAQRDFVRAVAERVEVLLDGGSVFFDEWFEYYIAGDDADLRLQDIYLKMSDLVVVCVSSAYNDRPWTQLEHRAIRALTMSTGRASMRLLSLRVGDGEVEGIHTNAFIPDVRTRSPDAVAELICVRLEHVQNGASGNRSNPAPPRPTADKPSADALISELCSKDPSVAMPAARELACRDEVVHLILDRPAPSMEPIPLAAVRVALRDNEEAALALASRVLEGNSRWHVARQAAHDLDTSHAPFCQDKLGTAFARSERDGQRILCWALGNLGAISWGQRILDRLSKDSDAQYIIEYALKGFSEMFRHSRREDVRSASRMFREALALAEQCGAHGHLSLGTRYTLGFITGDHVDAILNDWLMSPSSRIREMGVASLGDACMLRAISGLEVALQDVDERVRRAASIALGSMSTPEATEALIRSGRETPGMAFCIHLIADEADFRAEAERALANKSDFRWAAIRAAGLRGAEELIAPLRNLLNSSHELERGCALLALARLGDPKARSRIEAGMRESSGDSFEKVMSILALVTIHPDRYDEVDVPLRASLAEGAHYFWNPAQVDIINVLESVNHPQALHVAKSWRPFFPRFWHPW